MVTNSSVILHGYTPKELESLIDSSIQKAFDARMGIFQAAAIGDDMPEMLPRIKAAKMLNIAASTLDKWANAGKVTRYKSGGATRFKKSELLAAFQSLGKYQHQK